MTSTIPVLRDTPQPFFTDRAEAGRVLGTLLEHYRGAPDVVVLGLAPGGVPVAREVAVALRAPLDVLVVGKLGAPGHPEVAFGALGPGGRIVVNDDVTRGLHLTTEQIRSVAHRAARDLHRHEAAYRHRTEPMDPAGKAVILVDDGTSTGATMFAAVEAIRADEPTRIVVAVPAATGSTCRELGAAVDEMVCATMPTPFLAVGDAYWNFTPIDDEQVRILLTTPTTAGTAAPDPVAAVRDAAIAAPDGVPPEHVLADLVGDARWVLLGASTHGTHEFYTARAAITRWLITERGFDGVALEADWPDAHRVHRYVRGLGDDLSATQALGGFERFPTWLWRNTVIRDLAYRLRLHNQHQRENGERQAGFYGLDLYSMHRSMHQVIQYLERADHAAAERAIRRYAAFDRTGADDGRAYGFAAALGLSECCRDEVVGELIDLQRNAAPTAAHNGEAPFDALRNAWTARSAEAYYRAMFADRVSAWNLRDRHMADTLDALAAHLGPDSRLVVWAHNAHIGDASASEQVTDGQLSLGQLIRERHGKQCRTIGFSTGHGTVTAATAWGGEPERMPLRPAVASSAEQLLHDTGIPAFLLRFDRPTAAAELLRTPRLERTVGVVYTPATERHSHYLHTRLADRYDAVVYLDRTTALDPLDPARSRRVTATPETFPTGL
ncbi:erythromycin esterase family protein [Nocardia terpenica]|uniref:Phosphoribosyltransferase domain-containing protein n=1 Tax=Nocardia terpenica TaxID=455432 RepID=A0A164NTD8_9NOCA|nr:erythromycin esterase family protein [Nocardia terpenica]KZM74703.1 hypothetical protein AWN90_21845 [Nocardia terpenica]NQE93681.1 hypothetical protein [Nocardia terpenica]